MKQGEQQDKEKERMMQAFGEMVDELREWREEHGEASFDEIAAQVTPRRRKIVGELLEVLAYQQGSGMVAEGRVCEECGQEMRYKGELTREVEHYLEGETELERAYYYCAHCEGGIFPPG
jgi:hypothetical protein